MDAWNPIVSFGGGVFPWRRKTRRNSHKITWGSHVFSAPPKAPTNRHRYMKPTQTMHSWGTSFKFTIHLHWKKDLPQNGCHVMIPVNTPTDCLQKEDVCTLHQRVQYLCLSREIAREVFSEAGGSLYNRWWLDQPQLQKYAIVKMGSSSPNRDEHKKYLSYHHQIFILENNEGWHQEP